MRSLVWFGLLLLLLSGCGPTTQLQGQVAIDGQPLSEGSISFEPADGQGPSCGGTIQQGRFHIVSATPITPGKKRVRIRGSIKTGKQIPAGPPHPPSTMIDEVRYFPAVGEPELVHEAEVEAGKLNDLRFDLKSKTE